METAEGGSGSVGALVVGSTEPASGVVGSSSLEGVESFLERLPMNDL